MKDNNFNDPKRSRAEDIIRQIRQRQQTSIFNFDTSNSENLVANLFRTLEPEEAVLTTAELIEHPLWQAGYDAGRTSASKTVREEYKTTILQLIDIIKTQEGQ